MSHFWRNLLYNKATTSEEQSATQSNPRKMRTIMWPRTKKPFFSFWPPAKYDPSLCALCCLRIMPAFWGEAVDEDSEEKYQKRSLRSLSLCKCVCFPPEITCSRSSFLLLNEPRSEPSVSTDSPVCRVCSHNNPSCLKHKHKHAHTPPVFTCK